ncbi:MAG: hypothetical protein JXB30_18340 [Anaerolineae bacterium]|nr:hypothetical protein [Anaerolineae bacterium]
MTQSSERGRPNFIIGLMLIGLGALFLLGQVFRVNTWQLMLPFFFVLPGILFFVGMTLGGKAAGPLAIPGSIVTTAGLLLFFQGFTDYYQSWAYAWALIFPTSVGVGLMIHGMYSDEPRLVDTGRRWLAIGLIVFLAAGAFFEILVFKSMVGRIVWPGLMIILGAYLLMRKGGQEGGSNGRIEAGAASSAEAPTKPPAQTKPIKAPAPPPPPEFEPIDKPRTKRKSTPKKAEE